MDLPCEQNKTRGSVPIGDSKIIRRAIERARLALECKDADLGVGFSEGVVRQGKSYFTAAWCAVVTRNGECHVGGGLHIPLPAHLLSRIRAGVLLESDIEMYLQNTVEKPFERIVEYAMMQVERSVQNHPDDE
jgi:non-canonical (house-cleaning) NTP pyrophosphatase